MFPRHRCLTPDQPAGPSLGCIQGVESKPPVEWKVCGSSGRKPPWPPTFCVGTGGWLASCLSSVSARRPSAVGRVCRDRGPPAGLQARVAGAVGGTGVACVAFQRLSCGPVPTRLEPWFPLPECSAVPLCDCSGFFSHVYAAQAADGASSRDQLAAHQDGFPSQRGAVSRGRVWRGAHSSR